MESDEKLIKTISEIIEIPVTMRKHNRQQLYINLLAILCVVASFEIYEMYTVLRNPMNLHELVQRIDANYLNQ